jgi:hypothetical protein
MYRDVVNTHLNEYSSQLPEYSLLEPEDKEKIEEILQQKYPNLKDLCKQSSDCLLETTDVKPESFGAHHKENPEIKGNDLAMALKYAGEEDKHFPEKYVTAANENYKLAINHVAEVLEIEVCSGNFQKTTNPVIYNHI